MATAKKTTAPKTTAVTKAKASLPMPADAAERMRADIEAMKAKLAAPGTIDEYVWEQCQKKDVRQSDLLSYMEA